jgi:hypothetical protein
MSTEQKKPTKKEIILALIKQRRPPSHIAQLAGCSMEYVRYVKWSAGPGRDRSTYFREYNERRYYSEPEYRRKRIKQATEWNKANHRRATS